VVPERQERAAQQEEKGGGAMTVEIFDVEQGSPDWYRCRLGIPTASEFKAVLAKGEGKTRKTYMMKLIGERFTGEPADSYTNGHMERGKAMEDDARRLYCFAHDAEVVRVGFIRNGDVGCSPDGLIGANGITEIKTKLPHLQVEAIFAGKLPPEHKPQVQGELWVAEREWVDFVSYWPKLPLFVTRVFRDEDYIKALAAEVRAFNEEMDALCERLQRQGAARAA
jgi:hypothetical protein